MHDRVHKHVIRCTEKGALRFLIFEALKEAQEKIRFVTTERREEVI